MSKIKISCDEATTICDKKQYGEASFSDKVKLTFHMLLCKICKCYSGQNNIMTKVYKAYSDDKCDKEKCLSKEEKQELEKNVKEKIK